MRVAAPPGVPSNQAVVYANGSAVAHTVAGNMIEFTLPTPAARPSDWAVTGPGV